MDMPTPFADIDAQLRQRASAIRLCCFDVDGTLTDGRLWFNADGEALKAFHVHDGQGLRLLEDHGIDVTAEALADLADSEIIGHEHGLTITLDASRPLTTLDERSAAPPDFF